MQVEKRDVIEAFRLLEVAMQQSATDHSTGSFLTALVPFFYTSFTFHLGRPDLMCFLTQNLRDHRHGSYYNWNFGQ